MTSNIIWGTDFKSKTKPTEDLNTLANEIFAQAITRGEDLFAGKVFPNGIDDLPFDGKDPA